MDDEFDRDFDDWRDTRRERFEDDMAWGAVMRVHEATQRLKEADEMRDTRTAEEVERDEIEARAAAKASRESDE